MSGKAPTTPASMISEDDEYPWSPQAEAAWKVIAKRRNCEICGVEDPPIMSLDGVCEECLHKQGRAICCLEGECRKGNNDQDP